jgi:hypothetical protein
MCSVFCYLNSLGCLKPLVVASCKTVRAMCYVSCCLSGYYVRVGMKTLMNCGLLNMLVKICLKVIAC